MAALNGMTGRVLVLGGYGAFGARASERLARIKGIDLIVAGRSADKAHAFCRDLSRRFGVSAIAAVLDAERLSADAVAALAPDVVINASGPFQAQDYAVARAAMACSAHYVDLADAGAFAIGIASLDAQASAADVLVTSGASSVPALSAAVVDHHRARFAELHAITTVISPANSFDPGLATARSILGTLGKPIPAFDKGAATEAYGWQRLTRQRMPGLGMRWISDCDAPDLAIFPKRYPGLRSVRVCAGLEVGLFHLGLWAASGLVRAGLVRKPDSLAAPMLAMKRSMRWLGSDRGGMTVTMTGRGSDGRPLRLLWSLVAGDGHGPNIPAIPSAIIAQKLIDGRLATRGAMPAVGLFTLDEFRAAVADLAITDTTDEAAP